MASVFDQIYGQPQVRDFLRSSVAGKRVTHAYLYTGPAGSNKTAAAFALAAALLCEEGGCGQCEICQRVAKKRHPDVRYYAPEGATGYLVEQIREIVSDAELAPIQGKRKVYIIDRIEQLGVSAANAFLKTLEEPPPNVVIILLGRTRESVLPTIVSRCIVVPFRHIPATEAAAILSQQTGAGPEEARIAIEACGGSISKAKEYINDKERNVMRESVAEILGRLDTADLWDVITCVREIMKFTDAPLDLMRKVHEEETAASEDFLAPAVLKDLEKRQKRELSAKTLDVFGQILTITASILRDVMAVSAQTPELVINYDMTPTINAMAAKTDVSKVVTALAAVKRCRSAINHNVSPETCLDALFFEIGSALYGSHSAR